MNSVLLWLGIAVALLLSAAFAVPFFVDWSNQREFFEARATAMLGRPVAFEGPLEVRLVPFPSLEAENVRIGTAGEEGAERVTIRAALAPLLSGELQISEITLVRPRAEIRIDAGGEVHWAQQAVSGDLPLAPGSTRIDQFEILDGEIAIADERTGLRHVARELNLTGSASTLEGPWRVEGGGAFDDTHYTVRVATGRISPDGALRVTAGLSPVGRPLSAHLDGMLRFGGKSLAYGGSLVVERPAVEDDPAMPWRLEGEVAATSAEAVMDRLSLRLGPETGGISLSGAATVALGERPGFDAVLSARQIDLDRSFGGGPDAPVTPAEALSQLAGLLDPSVFPIPGTIGLDVGSLVVSQSIVETLAVDLEVEPERWRIARARAFAPGRTDVGLSGVIDFTAEGPSFDGALRVSGQQAGTLAAWLFGPEARVPGIGAVSGAIEAGASIGLDAGGVRLDDLDVMTEATELTGSLAYSAPDEGDRGRLEADIRTDRFEIDPERLDGRTPVVALAAAVTGIDLDIAFEADRLAVAPLEIGDVALTLAASGGELVIDRLRLGDLGGARLTGQGAVSGLRDAPRGSFTGRIEAESLVGLAGLLETLGAPEAGRALSARAEALAPAALDIAVEATPGEQGTSRAAARIEGTAAGTGIAASLSVEGPLTRLAEAMLTVELEAENPQGATLAMQLGLPGAESVSGPGRLSAMAEGRPSEGMPGRIELSGLGLDGSFEGRARFPGGGYEISGALDATLTGPAAMARDLGLRLPDAGGALGMSAEVSAVDEVWRFSDLAVSSDDGMGARGTIAVDFAGAEHVVDGSLEVTSFDLPWLLSAALGPEAVAGPAEGENIGESAWPTAPFAPLDLTGWRGGVSVTTPRLALGGPLTARQAAFRLDFDQGRLGLHRMTGNLLGGEATGAVELGLSEEGARFSGRIDLSGARLEELVWRDGGRPVASGTLGLGFDVAGQGRSMAGLVATLSGDGSLRITEGTIRRLNPNAFDIVVRAADAGLELTEERVEEAFAGHLDAGSLEFERAEGSLTIDSGVARMRNIRIDAQALDSFASAIVDLTQMAIDSEWSLSTDAAESGRRREVGLVFAGPVAAPDRLIDVDPLLGYLTVRAFEQDVERLERLQSEILERERLGRELIRLGEERRRREREAEEARQAEQARQRETEEAAARRAEQEVEEARRAEEEEAERQARAAAAAEALRNSDGTGGEDGLAREDFEQMIEDVLRGLPADGELGPRGEVPQANGATTAAPTARADPLRGTPIDITPPVLRRTPENPIPAPTGEPMSLGRDGLF